VLEHGRVVESGAWDELIAKENGRFRALCRAQGLDIVNDRVQDAIQIESYESNVTPVLS